MSSQPVSPFPGHIRALAVIPRRLGELALIAGLVAIILSNFGWHAWAGWSSTVIGGALIVLGGVLIVVSRIVRARLIHHHARREAEFRQKV